MFRDSLVRCSGMHSKMLQEDQKKCAARHRGEQQEVLGERSKSLWGHEGLLAQGFMGGCINIADAVGLQSSILRLF